MDSIADKLQGWFSDPTAGTLISLAIGVLVIAAVVRLRNRSLARMIKDSGARYRTRKLVTFGGYVAIALLFVIVYSGKFGGLTVALGVAGAGIAGAGIAFALQEIIASFVGWFAIASPGSTAREIACSSAGSRET